MPSDSRIEERIERLEARQNALAGTVRRWRAVSVLLAALLLAGGVLGLAADPPPSEVLRAKRIEILNDAGEPVIFLDTWLEGGWIHAANARGVTAFSARVDQEGSGALGVFDANGQRSVHLGINDTGQGEVATNDRRGRALVRLGGSPAGGAVEVLNTAGAAVATARVDASGTGEFARRSLGGEWLALSGTGTPDQPAEAPRTDLIAQEGQSVTYNITSTRTGREGQPRTTEARYIITMLEGVKHETGSAHWLEIVRPGWRGEERLYRVLVLDDHLTGEVNPFEHILTGFQRSAEGDVEEFDERMMQFAARILPPVPWMDKFEEQGREPIEAAGRTIQTTLKKGTSDSTSQDGDFESHASGTLHVSKDVPFRLVKADVASTFNWRGRESESHTTLELQSIESGAKSRLFSEE